MSENRLRNRIGKFILVSYSIIFLLIIVYSILPGFDEERFGVLIGYLAPVGAVYIGALIKYSIANRNVNENDALEEKKVNHLYVIITNWAIPLHFVLIFLFINLVALNQIDFKMLNYLFSGTETLFGVYIGLIISSLYNVDNETVQES